MKKRFFVRKKENFRIEEINLLKELEENLYENKLESIEIYNIYDCFEIDEKDEEILKNKILKEIVTDNLYENIKINNDYIAMEFLPGQFDQRGNSAMECLQLSEGGEKSKIKSGKLFIFQGKVKDLEKIKKYLINPLESREKNLNILEDREDFTIKPMKTYEEILKEKKLSIKDEDLREIEKYFSKIGRKPNECEIRVLDTYWSDHCRHSTFESELTSINITEGLLKKEIEKELEVYYALREKLKRDKKPVTLMDMGTIGGKYLKSIGKLEDLEESEEINACSVEIDVDVDGQIEKWLLMFKNETHNHPTEIEPFGGASTCIGGAIRDPLSGRAYVYQGMRITGAGDINEKIEKTLENKLPQGIISKGAAKGFSSYGNQIGMATTFVREIYHRGYVAKRMEVGAVVGAVKKENIKRETPVEGDIVLLIGGATGRDGIGGATGSSKKHEKTSLVESASEVQRGNAPIERKIQRLFRNEKVSKLIKKSNDFGAGGVAVAIGEIARGIEIDLDKVPKKYEGLNGVELAISESQERMGVVIDKKDYEEFKKLALKENLEVSLVAKVTKEEKLIIKYEGKNIVEIDRDFLDTNGVRGQSSGNIKSDVSKDIFKREYFLSKREIENILRDENVGSQRGMVEMFDSTVGRGTVLMPYGGKFQLSENEGSVQKLPVEGYTNTASILTYGFNPYISEKNTFLGGIYAVVESLSKIVALGGDYKKVRMSFQEYFEKLGDSEEKWGKVIGAVLGGLNGQLGFSVPAIGGKDSMSGTYENINVPPTLIAFGVTTENCENIVSSDFKEDGNYIYLVDLPRGENLLPDYEKIKEIYEVIHEEIKRKNIVSTFVIKSGGIIEGLCKMALGNSIGFKVENKKDYLDLKPGSFLIESRQKLNIGEILGETTKENLCFGELEFTHENIKNILEEKYEGIYVNTNKKIKKSQNKIVENRSLEKRKAKVTYEKPKVLIVVFPGTNCEYDSKKAFENAGGEVEIFIFNNIDKINIRKSLEKLVEKIEESQILMFPGGFSGGDEPDGSGKFISVVLQNESIKKSVEKFLEKEGLILGICNGFQGLIKSGLLPNGKIGEIDEISPTLFKNDINRHVSRMGRTRIVNNSSPWLSGFNIGEEHIIPMSHGEGKFVVNEEIYEKLWDKGQIVTEYIGEDINGSLYGIEGITSPCGQIFGKMGHSERFEEGLLKNIYGNKIQNIFKNGVEFFKK